jgi:hypothetical protein
MAIEDARFIHFSPMQYIYTNDGTYNRLSCGIGPPINEE